MPRQPIKGNAPQKVQRAISEIRARGLLYREATVSPVNLEARTVEIAFSSEASEVPRWFGLEVLGHSPGEVDLSRLRNKAPVLWMHDTRDQRGVVESAQIDSDKIGRALVRLSKSAEGEKLLQDIADGIVTKVSVGYTVAGLKWVEERGDTDVYRVTEWQPYEVSFVSVPADDGVGVGRSAEPPPVAAKSSPHDDDKNLNPAGSARGFAGTQKQVETKILRNAAGDLVRAKVDKDGNIAEVLEVLEKAGAGENAARSMGQQTERERVQALRAMGEQYGRTDLALRYIGEGKTPEAMRQALLDDFVQQRSGRPLGEQVQDANIGLTENEAKRYSILRAARYLADPTSKANREAAGFELECSRAAASAYGMSPKGLIIPNDVLASRAFGTGGASGAGSNIIAQNLLAGSFIEILRTKTWLMQRARTLAGLVGNVDIPRQNGSAQAYWVGEGGAPTPSTPAVDQIHFTPKTAGAYTDITRQLLMQSTPDAEAIVRDDLMKVMARAIDRAGIYGTGSNFQPKGLANIPGINTVTFTTAGKPTYAELVEMETRIALLNADVGSMSYAMNAGIRGYAKTALKFPGTAASGTIWEPGNTVNGYATDVSNQIQTGEVYFGNWQDLVIAMWGGLELTVDPYALSTSGGLRLISLQSVDINVRHVESFTLGQAEPAPAPALG